MNQQRAVVQAVILQALGLAALAPAAEVGVTTIGRQLDSLELTEQVRHFSFDTGEENEILKVGQELAVGDEVVALTDDLFVELTCPGGSQLHFSGRFRLQINLPTGSQDCAIDTRDGSLDVLTDAEVETCSAGVCAATGGTRFAVTLDRSGSGAEPTITVLEGSVAVTAKDQRTEVTTRKTLRVKTRADEPGAVTFETTEVTARQLDQWAGVYARYDLVNARAAGVEFSGDSLEEAQVEFTRLHAAVLAAPEAKEPRAELAAKQVTYKVDRAALYNAQRSGLVTQEQVRDQQIDPGRLRPSNEIERQRLEVLIRDQGAAGGVQSFTAPSPVAGLSVLDHGVLQQEPPAAASAEQRVAYWRRQVAVFESLAGRGELDARKYLAAARAKHELGDTETAATLAKRAILLNRTESLLSARELAYAAELVAVD